MSTLKTIAEYMPGWRYEEQEGIDALLFGDECIWDEAKFKTDPTKSRLALQLVLEEFNAIQLGKYEAKASLAWVTSESGAKAWYLLPTTTLADIAAQVIKETT